MNQLTEQLKALKLHGMAQSVTELLAQKKLPSLLSALPSMIEAEQEERKVRRIHTQMTAAKFPHHKDFATFDYDASAIDKTVIEPLCTGHFAQQSHNLILVNQYIDQRTNRTTSRYISTTITTRRLRHY